MKHYTEALPRLTPERLFRLPVACLGVVFLLCMSLALQAQTPDSIPQPPVVEPELPDTTPLYFVQAYAPEVLGLDVDTMAGMPFRQYDPARLQLIDYGTLGNVGAAARPLLFEAPSRRGFDVGVRAFDIYRLQPEDLRFYRRQRTFSDVYFSQGGNQDENAVKARFSRTFSDGANISFDYRTITNLGAFKHQAIRHNTLLGGLWLPVGRRYEGFLIFSNNINRQQENGGVTTDDLLGSGGLEGALGLPIFLKTEKAVTRAEEQTWHLTQHLLLGGAQAEGKRALRATHRMEYRRQWYKFYDTDVDESVAYYDTFLVDERGLRNNFRTTRIDNELLLSTFKIKNNGRPADELRAGISHSFVRIDQETSDTTLNNLFLTGKLALTPSERFKFEAAGDLGVVFNFGEYRVRGSLQIGLGKAGIFQAGLLSQRVPPTWMQHQLVVSKRPFWNNQFDKPVENSISAAYSLPALGFRAEGRLWLLSNYIYFDQRGLATQTTAPVQVAQLILQENLKFGPFRLENTIAFQQNSRSELLRLPSWATKNSLYVRGKIFKKTLLLDAGVDFRMSGAFRADNWQPVVWQFHLQDTFSQKPYPWADVFISGKIQSFRFFVRYENAGAIFNPETVFYQTATYPQRLNGLRFGIGWRFMDRNRIGADQKNRATAPPGVNGQSSDGSTPVTQPVGTGGRRGRG